MYRILRGLESTFHIAMLLLLTGALVPLWREMTVGKADPAEGDPIMQAVLLAGYLIGLLLLLPYVRGIPGLILRTPLLWLLIGWAITSVGWSEAPEVTFRKAAAVLLTTLYALVLATRHSFPHWLRLLALTFGIALVCSLAVSVLIPEWGIVLESRSEPWRGWYVTKNVLGRTAILGVLVLLFCLVVTNSRVEKLLWTLGIASGLFLLFKSDSKASLLMLGVTAAGAIFFWWTWQLRRIWPLYLYGVLLLVGSVGVTLLQNAEVIAQALGRDLTLTGRIPLWETVMGYIVQRPWLGYGYAVFWIPSGYGGEVSAMEGWEVPHAHNAYMDLWLDLGFLGFALGFYILLRSFQVWHGIFMQTGSPEALFWLVALVYLVVYNFAESALLRPNSLPWVLLSVAYAAGESTARLGRQQPQVQGAEGL